MTCKQVLSLIAALPVREWQPHQYNQVKHHAKICSDCRYALLLATELESGLKHLPNPQIPAGLSERILWRTAQIHKRSRPALGTLSRSSAIASIKGPRQGVFAWIMVLGGAAIVIAAWFKTSMLSGFFQNSFSSLIGSWIGSMERPDARTTSLLLGTGVFLYVAGFLASLLNSDFSETSE